LILATDANILITLFDVNRVDILPRIAPTEILDVVLNECEHPSQPGLREAVFEAGITVVASDMSWAERAKQMRNGGLSFPDVLCLCYALEQARILLSGDKPLRNRCEEKGVEYRGAIWIVREAYKRKLVPAEELCGWLKTWPLMQRRLPRGELDRLKNILGC